MLTDEALVALFLARCAYAYGFYCCGIVSLERLSVKEVKFNYSLFMGMGVGTSYNGFERNHTGFPFDYLRSGPKFLGHFKRRFGSHI